MTAAAMSTEFSTNQFSVASLDAVSAVVEVSVVDVLVVRNHHSP